MKKIIVLSMMVGAGIALAMPVVFADDAPAVTTTTTVVAPAAPVVVAIKHDHPHDRHPMVHQALRKLKGAKESLEKADHDYGGHRTKAIADIELAIGELKAGLAEDKK